MCGHILNRLFQLIHTLMEHPPILLQLGFSRSPGGDSAFGAHGRLLTIGLPLAGQTEIFEEHVATPTGLDFARAAALYGCEHELVTGDVESFGAALDRALTTEGVTILEVRTKREENFALHRAVSAAVASALAR